jgi:hypothetical protein
MGEIVWHANQLQSGLFKVFWSILGIGKQRLALGIWHSFKSDAAQREMLEAVAASELPAKSRELRALRWVCKEAAYLSGRRNDFVHTASMRLADKNEGIRHVVDMWSARPDRLQRFRAVPPARLSRALERDMRLLSAYADCLGADMLLHASSKPPLPRRPRLQVASLLRGKRLDNRQPLWPSL